MYEEDVHFQVIYREEIADDLAQIQESFGCNVKTGPKSTKPLKTGDAMLTDLRFTWEYGPADRNNTALRRFKGHRLVSNLQSTRKPPGLNGNGKIWKNQNLQLLLHKAFPRPAAPIAIASWQLTWYLDCSFVNPSMAFLAFFATVIGTTTERSPGVHHVFGGTPSSSLQSQWPSLPCLVALLGMKHMRTNSERIGSIQTLQLGYCVLFQSEVQTCVQRAFSCCNCSNVHEDYEEWQNKGDSSFNWAMAASLRLRGYHITPRLGLTWGFETLG